MIKEIEIKGVSPKKKTPTDIVDSLPVGSTVNGVTKAKEFTEYEEETEEQEQEGSRKWVLTDDDILTKEQEEELKERFIQEKTDEIMNAVKELSKGYMPKENIDVGNKVNEEDMFGIARKIFGIEKQPSRLEKFKKFVQACQKAAEEREQNENKKEKYVAPECKVIDGVIKFNKPDDGMELGPAGANEPRRSKSFEIIALELIDLHNRKNNDYGNAAHQSYQDFGIISYVIRLNDKLNRLKSLTKPNAEQQVKEESIVDTLMDLAAYSIMAIESLSTLK